MTVKQKLRINIPNLLILFLIQIPFLALGFNSQSPVIGNLPLEQNLNISRYAPINQKNVPEILISRDSYLLSYNPENRQVNWAAWKVEFSDIGSSGRSNNFLPDPDLTTYLMPLGKQSVVKEDYKGSCYDRGHQVPSGDRTINSDINQLTFFMSNMVPQTAYLNRIIWQQLESYTRELVKTQNKKVYVISGPIYDEDFGKIGPNSDITVPSKNFKVLIIYNKDQDINDSTVKPEIISVVMPNILKTGKKPYEDKTELCKESVSLADKPPTPPTPTLPPVDPPTPNVNSKSVSSQFSDNAEIDSQNEWTKYKARLDEVEKTSGFKIEAN